MTFLNYPYIPAASGTPTGTPASVTGGVALKYDNTNHLLYGYSGSAWRLVGPSVPFSISNGGTGSTTFTTNGVTRYDGSAITNDGNFLYDGTNVSLGASLDAGRKLNVESNSSMTNAYGVWSSVSGGTNSSTAFRGMVSGTGTTNYGCYLNVTGATNNWAIYVAAGDTLLAKATVSNDLYVNGSSVLTGTSVTSLESTGMIKCNGSLGTGSTSGFFYLSDVGGTPTGTPTGTPSGTVPLCIDSSGSKLCAYIGGAWKYLTFT